jgi:crotonobetainyl-CoA:carnitine CoA-transferase CaiB-like acyl-CoA transferase
VLAALLVQERTGAGTAISVGLFDAVAEWMGFALNQARYSGIDPQPNGLSSPMVAPYGAYRTGDGQVLVLGTTNDREWRRLAGLVLGRPDLADDPRYARNALRVARRRARRDHRGVGGRAQPGRRPGGRRGGRAGARPAEQPDGRARASAVVRARPVV